MFTCHPERSEGSPSMARESLATEILRFAQDDMRRVFPILNVKVHNWRCARYIGTYVRVCGPVGRVDKAGCISYHYVGSYGP